MEVVAVAPGTPIVNGSSVYSFVMGLLITLVSGFAWGVGFFLAYAMLHHFDIVKL